MRRPTARVPTMNVTSARDTSLYPRIERAVSAIFQKGEAFAPIDVLVCVGLLVPVRFDDWRRGKLPFLEQVIDGNLTCLSRLQRIVWFHAHELQLMPAITIYLCGGKGSRRRRRATKSGDPNREEGYARHFVWPGKGPLHPPHSKDFSE